MSPSSLRQSSLTFQPVCDLWPQQTNLEGLLLLPPFLCTYCSLLLNPTRLLRVWPSPPAHRKVPGHLHLNPSPPIQFYVPWTYSLWGRPPTTPFTSQLPFLLPGPPLDKAIKILLNCLTDLRPSMTEERTLINELGDPYLTTYYVLRS